MTCQKEVSDRMIDLSDSENVMVAYWCSHGFSSDWILEELQIFRKLISVFSKAKKEGMMPLNSQEINQARNDLLNGTPIDGVLNIIKKDRDNRAKNDTFSKGPN
jgi:hypothetical protein